MESGFSARSSISTFHVYVGAHQFTFGDDMGMVFRGGVTYLVYYCHSGPYQLIMSFEALA
ncbi:MAG TPA: hypothetical protein VFH29_00550 [Anaerolineales bacterium]|nr:hypothetical protein [Anaerolineales bacterium]